MVVEPVRKKKGIFKGSQVFLSVGKYRRHWFHYVGKKSLFLVRIVSATSWSLRRPWRRSGERVIQCVCHHRFAPGRAVLVSCPETHLATAQCWVTVGPFLLCKLIVNSVSGCFYSKGMQLLEMQDGAKKVNNRVMNAKRSTEGYQRARKGAWYCGTKVLLVEDWPAHT